MYSVAPRAGHDPINYHMRNNDTGAGESTCPICGSSKAFSEYIEWQTHRWVLCRDCGGGHKEPYIPETEDTLIVEDRYDLDYFETEFFARRRKFAENQAEWLRRNFQGGMAVVELGPGLGLAAARFLEMLPGTPYHAVEPYSTFSEFIAKQLGDRVVMHTGDPERGLEDALREASAGGRAVLVYMDNVLEHLAGPHKFIGGLKAKLPKGSRALIDVPNERGLKYRTRIYAAIGGQTTMAPGHINLFTAKSFGTMLTRHGLRHKVHQRGIRRREEVNCLPEGPALDVVLGLLRVFPVDSLLGIANNLRVEVEF